MFFFIKERVLFLIATCQSGTCVLKNSMNEIQRDGSVNLSSSFFKMSVIL